MSDNRASIQSTRPNKPIRPRPIRPQESSENKDSHKHKSKKNSKKARYPKNSTQEISKRVAKVLQPYRLFMLCLGRFPVSRSTLSDTTVRWRVSRFSPVNLVYILVSVIHFLILFLLLFNGIGVTLNFPKMKATISQRADILHVEEFFLFRRNLLPYAIIVACAIHNAVSGWNWMWKGQFIADYFNFWTAAEDQMRLSVTSYTSLFTISVFAAYAGFVVCLIFVGMLRFSPICTGTPAILVQMLLRCFWTNVHTSVYFPTLRLVASILYLYIFLCSLMQVMLFMLHCQMLKHTIRKWNNRVDEALNGGRRYTDAQLVKTRSQGELLFLDQVVLMDLIEGNDTIFANIIESFYLQALVSVVMQVYFLYRIAQNLGDFTGIRNKDSYMVYGHLLFQFLLIVCVTFKSEQVGQETLNGIQSVRKKGLLTKKKQEAQLNLVLSMYYNYVGYWEVVVNAAKYFPIDTGLFLKALAGYMTYTFCIIQFSLSFSYTGNPLIYCINFTRLLRQVEHTDASVWGRKDEVIVDRDSLKDWPQNCALY